MSGFRNLGPTQADKWRMQAQTYQTQAAEAERKGQDLIPFGAVNTTPEQLRKWAKDLLAKANEWERLAAVRKRQRDTQREGRL
jgi:hypothetical protein